MMIEPAGERRSPTRAAVEALLDQSAAILIARVEGGAVHELLDAAFHLRACAVVLERSAKVVGTPIAHAFANLWRELANVATAKAHQLMQAAAKQATQDATREAEIIEDLARRQEAAPAEEPPPSGQVLAFPRSRA